MDKLRLVAMLREDSGLGETRNIVRPVIAQWIDIGGDDEGGSEP